MKKFATKSPVLMFMCGTEQPIMAHLIGHDVWLTPFDEFVDAGFVEESRIIPVSFDSCSADEDTRFAWITFMEDGEIGEPTSLFDTRARLAAFKTIFEALTGEIFTYKEVI